MTSSSSSFFLFSRKSLVAALIVTLAIAGPFFIQPAAATDGDGDGSDNEGEGEHTNTNNGGTQCPPGGSLNVTARHSRCEHFVRVLDSNLDPANVDSNNNQCCRGCEYSPFALFLPGVANTLALDPEFPNRLIVNADHTAQLFFTVQDRTDPTIRFSVRFHLRDLGACPDPKLELRGSCYVANGGEVDPRCWQCWQHVHGTIHGLHGSAYPGLVLNAEGYGGLPQVGLGANGKNFHLGLSFWFTYVVHGNVDSNAPGARPFPDVENKVGDVNIDLRHHCVPHPPSFKGDPHFVGFCSNVPTCRYDFHGERDRVFAIVSDADVQLNARFVGADLRPQKTFKTYIGAIGLVTPAARIRVECDRAEERHIIQVDGKELPPMVVRSIETASGPATITRDEQDRVTIDLPRYFFKLRFSSSAHSSCHINMRANYRTSLLQLKKQQPDSMSVPHGVLGQTADPTRKFPARGLGDQGEGIVQGRWQDYLIAGNDLFGTQFTYARWNPALAQVGGAAGGDDDDELFTDDAADNNNNNADDADLNSLDKIIEKSASLQ